MTAQSVSKLPKPTGSVQTTLPEVITDTLSNGLRYYFSRVNDLPLTEVSVVIDAGLSHEKIGEQGLAYATTHLLLSGSGKRSKQMIDDFLHEQAAIIVPYVHYDYAQLYARTLSRNFSALMDIMADGVISPEFPARQLATLVRTSTGTLPEHTTSPGELATQEILQLLCGTSTALTQRLLPSQPQLAELEQTQLVDFHARCYTPERTSIVITGNLDPAFVRTVVTERFGGWTRAQRNIEPTRTRTPSPAAHVIVNDTSAMTHYRLGIQGLARNDDRFPAIYVLNTILGGGSSSRLRSALWGRHVVSPSFTSNLGFSRGCSYLIISGTTSPLLADSVILLIRSELKELALRGITENELASAKSALLKDRSMQFASNRNVQSFLKEAWVYDLNTESVFTLLDSVAVLTVADVNAVAKFLIEKSELYVAIVGNVERLREAATRVFGKQLNIRE